MTETTFNALVITRDDDRKTHANFQALPLNDLPDSEVLVKIQYSSLNYKDGLAVTGTIPVVRKFPMVAGIDFVGTVEASTSDKFTVGDSVVLTGWGVGETHWGGYAEYARVPADYLVALPEGLSPQQAMAVGTAGFTAMMSVMALQQQNITPDSGDIVVTGASGGTGSMSIALLAQLGYSIVASTGREELTDYLTSLGAKEVIGRFDAPQRPVSKEKWAGAIDAVGGDTLAAVLAETQYGGSVACFGMAGGGDLNTTVYPFILRGVNLLGIDSVMCPADYRAKVWQQVTEVMTDDLFNQITQVESLSNIKDLASDILDGKVRGRIVIDVSS